MDGPLVKKAQLDSLLVKKAQLNSPLVNPWIVMDSPIKVMMMTFITKGAKAEGVRVRRIKLRKARADAVKGG